MIAHSQVGSLVSALRVHSIREEKFPQVNEKIYHHLLKKFLIISLSGLKGDLL